MMSKVDVITTIHQMLDDMGIVDEVKKYIDTDVLNISDMLSNTEEFSPLCSEVDSDDTDVVSGWIANKFMNVRQILLMGDKLEVCDLKYKYPPSPILKVSGIGSDITDEIVLECVGRHGLDSYSVEKPIQWVNNIEVVGYADGQSVDIQYVYLDSDTKSTKAHLVNGDDVDYNLSVLDVCMANGRFTDIPTIHSNNNSYIMLSDLRELLENDVLNMDRLSMWESIVNLSRES